MGILAVNRRLAANGQYFRTMLLPVPHLTLFPAYTDLIRGDGRERWRDLHGCSQDRAGQNEGSLLPRPALQCGGVRAEAGV